jgi:hypothetical protein
MFPKLVSNVGRGSPNVPVRRLLLNSVLPLLYSILEGADALRQNLAEPVSRKTDYRAGTQADARFLGHIPTCERCQSLGKHCSWPQEDNRRRKLRSVIRLSFEWRPVLTLAEEYP